MIFCLIITLILVACNGDKSSNENLTAENFETSEQASNTDIQTTAESDIESSVEIDATSTIESDTQESSESTSTENTTLEQSEETSEDFYMNYANLSEKMKYLFSEKSVVDDTLFIIDKGEVKSLLYPATKILSVTSYDGKITYVEGDDYILTDDGKLKITENSSIPCITSEVYYNYSEAMLQIEHNGEKKWVYWGEGDAMTKWQICVSYEHESVWGGYEQKCHTEQFKGVIEKLEHGEDITVFFYGDSITCGANSGWYVSDNIDGLPYSMLFVNSLADLFGYTVNYIDVSHLDSLIKATPDPYVAGDIGTITYINTAVGGWTAKDGINNFDTFVKPFIEQYGCDLFIVAFAGNDAASNHSPSTVASNYKILIESAQAICPELHFIMLSSMVNTPLSTNGWNTPSMLEHEEWFEKATKRLINSNKINGAVVGMTSMSMSLLDYKEFADYSGNNINHPNDFLHRVYAQLLFQAFIGYENLGV